VILHSGVTKAHRLNFATFERTWQRGNYWLLAMLPPDKTSAQLEPFIYTKASQDLLNTQQIDSGLVALKSATEQWPDYWLPYFLLGNYYYSSQPQTAAHWFAKGQPYAQQELPFLNNHAMLLSQLSCHDKASALIQAALHLAPKNSNLLDSQLQIQAAAAVEKAAVTQAKCQLEAALHK
jgi:hypothetical protein